MFGEIFGGRLEVENIVEMAMIATRLNVFVENFQFIEINEKAMLIKSLAVERHFNAIGVSMHAPARVAVGQAEQLMRRLEAKFFSKREHDE